MSVRSEVADELRDVVPSAWDVQDYYDVPDELDAGRPRIMLHTARVQPGGSLGLRRHELVVWLLDPMTEPGAVDDALDANLSILLDALDAHPLLAWTEAERGTLDESFPGYRITLTLQHTKE